MDTFLPPSTAVKHQHERSTPPCNLPASLGAELQPLYVVDIPTMVYGAPATIRASPVLAGVSTRWRIWSGEKMLGQTARV